MKKTFRFRTTLLGIKALIRCMRLCGKNATNVPGDIAVNICPDFLGQIDKPKVVIGVTGTNGKTSVSNLIEDVLSDTDLKFMDNRLGGNVDAGIASELIKNADLKGRMKKQYAVFEIDERMTTKIFPFVKPKILGVTNLFRDSYKRNAHSEYIFDILNSTIPKETKLVLNGEDPLSSHLAPGNKRVYFGIEDRSVAMNETEGIIQDMIACPQCGAKLTYDYIRYNHIGRAHCPSCDFASPEHFDYAVEKIDHEKGRLFIRTPKESYDIKLLGSNITDAYNQITAVAVLTEFGVSKKRIVNSFEKMEITKTRFEDTQVKDKHIISVLAKGQNPVACSRVCDFVRKEEGDKAVVLVIDDFFDRKETSENIAWFFDTDFEFLNDPSVKQIVIGGLRRYDLKLRLLMAGVPEDRIAYIDDDVKTAELVDLQKSNKVYIFYDVYTAAFAKSIKKRLTERIEAGAYEVGTEYEKHLHVSSVPMLSGKADSTSRGKGKVVEVLYPEFCNLFGDSSNIRYLKKCIPDAEFIYTAFTEEPYFVKNKPDLIYMGAMTEKKQEMAAAKLLPYKDRLKELIDAETPVLFTSNATELLGNYIETDDGRKIPCLSIYDFSAKRDTMHRINGLVRGHAGELEIIGFRTQFTTATPLPAEQSFITVDRGMGMNKEANVEGIHDKKLYATYLVGPFLALNPDFTERFLREDLGIENAEAAYNSLVKKAYKRRVKEFHNPKCEYDI